MVADVMHSADTRDASDRKPQRIPKAYAALVIASLVAGLGGVGIAIFGQPTHAVVAPPVPVPTTTLAPGCPYQGAPFAACSTSRASAAKATSVADVQSRTAGRPHGRGHTD